MCSILDLFQIRKAIRSERLLLMRYLDLKGIESTRKLWPMALGFGQVRMLAGWCELRKAFRHFRTDRTLSIQMGAQRYPRHRQILLNEWHEINNASRQNERC